MTNKSKVFLILLVLAFTIIFWLILLPWYIKQNAKNTIFEWCGLSHVGIVEEYDINFGGSMFTREFDWEFKIDARDVDKWIKDSPGLNKPKEIIEISPGIKKYIVTPYSGAAYGEVKIYMYDGIVVIKTYWS